MHYMGDRRTGRQLLADADADAAVTVAALARHLADAAADSAADSAGAEGRRPPAAAADGGVATGGYARACGGRGLLEGIAAAVGRLAAFLEAAGPAGVCYDAWARAVRRVSADL